MARRRYYFSDKLARKKRNARLCVAAILILAASASSAWSHELRSSDGLPAPAALASNSLPLSVTDSCLPLLKSIRQITPQNVTDKTQRPAGNIAALGLMLGYRFALGPAETPQHSQRSARAAALVDYRTSSGDMDGRNALATAAYRQCRKTEALSALAIHPEL